MFFAVLHEKSRFKHLFWEPDLDKALNCGRVSELSPKVIKMVIDTDSDFPTLKQRCLDNFASYLSPTEFVKIYSDSGTELFRFNGGYFVKNL